MVGGGRFIKEVVALYEKTLNPDELAWTLQCHGYNSSNKIQTAKLQDLESTNPIMPQPHSLEAWQGSTAPEIKQ
jgi:hypothetical protein